MSRRRLIAVVLAGFTLLTVGAVAVIQRPTNTRTYESEGVARIYTLHVPANLDLGKRYPLMFVFHGTGGNGQSMERITGFDAVADKYEFFVVYPDARNSQWLTADSAKDIAAVRDLIEHLAREYPIDISRVYASGLSNGGGFAQLLGCVMGDEIAGFGGVGYNMSETVRTMCKPSRPITTVSFHGTADTYSPYGGGKNYFGVDTMPSREAAAFWAEKNMCRESTVENIPDVLSDGSNVTSTKESWNSCAGDTRVEFYTITNGGHTWPGGSHVRDYGLISSLNASELIWQTLSTSRR